MNTITPDQKQQINRMVMQTEAEIFDVTGLRVLLRIDLSELYKLDRLQPPAYLQPATEKDIEKEFAQIVCRHFKISFEQLISTSRKANFVLARQVYIYLLRSRDAKRYSYSRIGKILHKKDHTTIMFAYQKFKELLEIRDADAVTALQAITTQLISH